VCDQIVKKIKTLLATFAMLAMLTSASRLLAMDEPPQVHFVVNAYEVFGDNPLSADTTRDVLKPFTGDHYGLTGLQAAADSLEKAFREQGFAFHRVILVPQELKQGIIKFKVTVFKLNKVDISGNQHFDEQNLLRNLPGLTPGETPNTNELSRAVNMASDHPSKSLKVKFAESETGGAIDAKVSVTDQKPDFFFAILNNTGTDDTGNFRLTGGYQFTNLFNRDHSLALSYTTAPDDTSAVSQYGAFYSAPFYESGSRLSFLYTQSDVDSGIIQQTFDVAGKGRVIALRYNKNFLQVGAYKHEIELGLDHKKFEDNTTFAGSPTAFLGTDVVSRPFSLFYKGSRPGTRSTIDFTIGGAMNISGGSLNEDADYIANNVATADWSVIRYGANYTRFFSDNWIFRLRFNGQETSDELIPGEKFGLGGMNSIRGFDERIILGDTGYQLNLELWFPTVTSYDIRPLVFYDYGHVELIDPAGLPPEEDPASIGAGLRWSWKQKLSVVLDYGYVTSAAGLVKDGDTRAHLDMFYRF